LSFSRNSIQLCAALAAVLAIALGLAGTASAAEAEFGFESTTAEESTSLAGAHPDLTLGFFLNHREESGLRIASGRLQELAISLPPGLVGNAPSFPRCEMGDFNAFGNCPVDSQVGIIETQPSELGEVTEPLFNLAPTSHNEIARFGFIALFYPITIDVKVRTSGDYGVTATVHDASGKAALVFSKATLWGVPADPVHDEQRLNTVEAFFCKTACTAPEGKRASGLLPPKPFLSNPTACEDQSVGFDATTYQVPGRHYLSSNPLPPVTECEDLRFEPHLQLEPKSHRAGAPTGLTASLRIPQNDSVSLRASSAMRAARVVLPEGMTINSAAANGLEACSDEQVGLGSEDAESNCPAGSRLGSASFISPALPDAIHGAIYQRTPGNGQLFRIWLVTDEFGLHLKLPGIIQANKATGQLTAEFTETPQLPVEEINLEFKGGPTAPLRNPETCGSYSAGYEFTPWSGAPVVSGQTQPMEIDEGCGGAGFSPKLEAGVTDPVAGAFSPLVIDLKREDGEDNLGSFALTLPKGQLAKLKGVPLCSDADSATGSCPSGSEIGSVAVASGVGAQPLWIPQPGKAPTGVFLAGPYKGAPYSVVTKVPAQAGPFDLGTVAVRSGLYIDPDTAQVTVKTDPLPQILEGVPISYRRVHVSIDRSDFAINPTNCREQQVTSTVTSVHGATASPADRFQVGECASLGFGPSLQLHLKGGTKRSQYPALTAILKPRKGDANIRKVSVALPHSEFLAQEHIDTICTRVQFAENSCPAGSIYGRARAVTPLLDRPLEGPVYLRSSSNPLPDMVVALRGQIDVNLVGRIDSVKGGIRTTFLEVPDAPVTKFVLRMKGGKKSLLVNSTDICAGKHRVTAEMKGQNGKRHAPHPLLKGSCRKAT
jgi:hypothetical protein